MSQRARSEAESGVREDSGLVPNPTPSSTPVERIGALTSDELAEIAPPQRGLQSGAFTKRADGSNALDWQAFKSPPPPPPLAAGRRSRLAASAERAELPLAEPSLQLANPFFGSSLQPPPPKKRSWLRPLLITVAGAALLCAGYAGALYQRANVPATARTVDETPSQSRTPVIEDVTGEVATPASAVTAVTATHATAVAVAQPALDTPAAVVAAPVAHTPAKVRAAADAKPRRAARSRARVRAGQKASVSSLTEARATGVAEASDVKTPAAVAPTASKTAQQLTRAQVQTGLERVRPALKTCAAGTRGQMMANVTISGAGRVTYATVEGAFAGTSEGSCMARALRGAQFPSFASEQLRVRYPFVF